jgi:plasmid stabilization system protein ParE
MTRAEEIVKSGVVPRQSEKEAAEITKRVADAFIALQDTPEIVPHTMRVSVFRRLSDDQRKNFKLEHLEPNQFDDMDDEDVLQLTDSKGEPLMVIHPLHNAAKHHGLHAYRYEEQSDGSVLAIYANDEKGKIKLKAFENMQEASLWSPREERKAK